MDRNTMAVISDVHGNRWALEAVLDDIDRRGLKQIVNLGDCLYGPLDPAATADLLMSRDIPTVSGNEDREILETGSGVTESPTLEFTRKSITPGHKEWIRALEFSTVFRGDFYLCHGTPDSDREYLLRSVTQNGVAPRSADRLMSLLAGVKQPVVLCGHDHTPGSITLPDGRLIVNPGSVGLQAYTDNIPYDHHIATGSPHARYAVLRKTGDTWQAETVTVGYDWQAASVCARKNGRADWAEWLATGRVVL